jgi:PAS domain S-box-containing protein
MNVAVPAMSQLDPNAPLPLLQALLDGVPEEAALVDAAGRLLCANQAFRARHGLTASSTGEPVAASGPGEALHALAQLTVATGQAQVRDEQRPTAEGDSWLMTTASPLLDMTGRPWAALLITRDETRVRRLEQELHDAQALYHSLVEQLPMHVFRKDRQGRFLFANARLCRMLGISRQEIVGKTDHDFSPRPLADKYRQDDERVMATGQVLEDVEEHHPRDGEPTFVQVFKTPVRNARQQVIGTQGFFIDITPMKQAEAELVRQRAELEQAVRALEENQQRLLLAEKMASLGRLTAGIAHEMNTPLAAVRAALAELDALAAEYQSSIGDHEVSADDHRQIAAEMQRSLKIAATAARRAAGFVQGIKSQTRDLAPRERVRFDAAPVIEEALLLLTHASRQARCTLRFEPPPAAVPLMGAPGRLAQVVTNLVKNALDATKAKGEGAVVVRLLALQDRALLEVEDSGTGITPDVVNKIFDPMFTTKPFGEGTGLGLTIVHDIVVGDFGGSIDVRTEPGRGTTFVVAFPAPEANGEDIRHAP